MNCGQGTIELRRVKNLANVALIRAHGVEHSLPRHMHDKLCVTIVDGGVREARHRGVRYLIGPGLVQIIPGGEAHTCGSQGGRYSYRVLCLDEAALRCGALGTPRQAILFRSPVIEDGALYRTLAAAHDFLAGPAGTMEKEATLAAVWDRLTGYTEPAAGKGPGGERGAVRLIKDYLAERFTENISLNELVLLTGLSPHHLVRVFTDAVGMPPHAYLNQVRVTRAKKLLAAGGRLADAALAVGFADQSHFQRMFKRVMGITPGKYLSGL